MTSPETPSPEPQRGMFAIGDGSWKGMIPFATLIGIFLMFMVGMLGWFDIRITAGLDGVERRLTAQIGGVEKRLTDRIDQVETGLNARIDRVEKRLSDRIDEVKAELAASESRRAAVDAQLSADIEQVAAGVAENRAAHRELAGFVRASRSQEPPPATDTPGSAPAQ